MSNLVKVVTAPVRVPVGLAIAVPEMIRELPGAARDLRAVLGGLARMTARDGELTALMREAADVAARSGHEGPSKAPGRSKAASRR